MAKKVALITGAARGIGLATAKLLLADGWRVAVLDRDEDALTDAVSTLGNNVLKLLRDVSKPDDADLAISECLKTFGRARQQRAGKNQSTGSNLLPRHLAIATSG